MNVTFSLKLPKECLKYDKEMSYHNHNYYNIDFSVLGICIFPTKCEVLYQECAEDSQNAYYSLGYFISNKNNKTFVPCSTWKDEYYFID